MLGVPNPVQNNVLDLEESVGALHFLDRYLDALIIPSNFLDRFLDALFKMLQNTQKNEKVNLLNLADRKSVV